MRVRHLMVIGLVVVAASGCVSNERFEAASQEVENQDDVIAKLRAQSDELERENSRLRSEAELSQVEMDRLRREVGATQNVDALKAELADLRSRFANMDDVIKVRPTAEGTALSVEGHVVFALGKAELSDRGREVLSEIADRVRGTTYPIRVEGHTDNIPVTRLRGRYPLGNLQLSGARSLQVADFLIETAGLPRDRVSFAGYGPEKPVADNSTEDGRRQNRRVEIVVLNRK